MINNLKAIKLNAWDDIAIRKIQEARGEELSALEMRYYITTISQTLLWFAPIGMSMASIGLYQYLNNEIVIQDIFSSLGIFTSFKGLLRNLPNTLNVLVETLLSLGRIEKFLDLPEVDDSNIEKDDEITMKKKIALQITNGSFTWNKNYQEQKSKISERLNINIHEEKKDSEPNNKDIINNNSSAKKPKLRRNTMMGLSMPPLDQKKKNEFFSSDDESSEENNSNENEDSEDKSDDENDAISLNESQKGTKDQKIYAL